MLNSLHIENIAVIESADVEFNNGFCVLTGETGAGKSILIDSINAVLGERTSKELIRTGCDRATVRAVFTDISDEAAARLEEFGFDAPEHELIISRVITESKSTVKINGHSATAAVARELAPLLINIHGQHDSQALLNPDKHYIYIDLLADNGKLLEDYQAAFSGMQSTRRQLKALSQGLEDKEKRMELLTYQVNEIEAADVKIGERESLAKRRDVINNAQNIVESLTAAYAALAGDGEEQGGAVSMCEYASSELMSVSQLSADASEINDSLANAVYQLEDIKSSLEKLISSFDFDKNELDEIEQRLDMYYGLTHKYGADEQEILNFYENAKNELKTIELADENIDGLQSRLAEQVAQVKAAGAALTESRKAAGERFARDVSEQLEFLDMPKVKIEVSITAAPYSRLGADRVEFLISTNPGEPLKPLSKIASGGEMSRIMLSIKNVLAKNDPVDTMIFDEIDTGISGRAAQKVGMKLKETARGKQIICVTHLAQIAAFGETHLLIEKGSSDGRASTNITALDFEGRKREIARIIGAEITETNLKSAEEMLKSCS